MKSQVASFFKQHASLLISLLILIILRIPSLYESHWYGDEGIYASVAYGIENGKKLYVDVFDNRLPGIYYIYALGESEYRQLFVRALSLVAGLITIWGVYAVSRYFKIKWLIWLIMLGALWLLGTPKIEATIANTENFFLPLTIWGVWFGLQSRKRAILISGILFGLAFLIKFPPFFTFLAVGGYVFLNREKKMSQRITQCIVLGCGFALPIAITFFMLYINGNLKEAIEFGLLNNSKYVSYYNDEGIPSNLKVIFIAVASLSAVMLYYSKRISSAAFFITLFILFDYFAVIFSGRKYEHYLLQLVPALVIAIGYYLQNIFKERTILLKVVGIVLFVIVYSLGRYVFYQGAGTAIGLKPTRYYQEFIYAVLNQPVTQSHLPFSFFKEPNRLRASKQMLKIYNTKSIYFYTNESWVYDFAKVVPPTFFVTQYHQSLVPGGSKRLVDGLKQSEPAVIAIDKNNEVSEELSTFIEESYRKDREDSYFVYYLRQ